jgi:hypothetical protein
MCKFFYFIQISLNFKEGLSMVRKDVLFSIIGNVKIRIKQGKEIFNFSTGCAKATKNDKYIPRRCPVCKQRLFDATQDSSGTVKMECSGCGNTVDITLGDEEKTAFAA